MARGLQKIEAQKKNQQNRKVEKGSQLAARKAGLKLVCPECKCEISNYKTLCSHMQARHPDAPLPPPPEK